jgi:hypothetical protein
MTVGDFDGDGRDEIAVAIKHKGAADLSSGNDFWVMKLDANDETWSHMNPDYTAQDNRHDFSCTAKKFAARFVKSGDFDGDGRDELAVAIKNKINVGAANDLSTGNDFWVMKLDANDETWSHMNPDYTTQDNRHDFSCTKEEYRARFGVVADYDGDGRDELAIAIKHRKNRSTGNDFWVMKLDANDETWSHMNADNQLRPKDADFDTTARRYAGDFGVSGRFGTLDPNVPALAFFPDVPYNELSRGNKCWVMEFLRPREETKLEVRGSLWIETPIHPKLSDEQSFLGTVAEVGFIDIDEFDDVYDFFVDRMEFNKNEFATETFNPNPPGSENQDDALVELLIKLATDGMGDKFDGSNHIALNTVVQFDPEKASPGDTTGDAYQVRGNARMELRTDQVVDVDFDPTNQFQIQGEAMDPNTGNFTLVGEGTVKGGLLHDREVALEIAGNFDPIPQ